MVENQSSGSSQEAIKPIKMNPFAVILDSAKSIRAASFKRSSADEISADARNVDKILKDLSALQANIGSIRREIGKRSTDLRLRSPKGRPAEGEIRSFPNGSTMIFTGGKWFLYEPPVVSGDFEET